MIERLYRDSGPIYAETDLSQFPVEPWNAASCFIFFIIVFHFYRKTKADFRAFPVVNLTLPMLFVGFAGGFIYHATRSHFIWLLLDFGPIALLALFFVLFLWYELTESWIKSVFLALGLFLFSVFVRSGVQGSLAFKITVSYSSLASMIVLPAGLLVWTRFKEGAIFLILSVISFAIAIAFRHFDLPLSESVLPMGTHFLWHIFGGFSVFCLLQFVYLYEMQSSKSVARTS